MAKVKVCFLITSLDYGGAETQLTRIAVRLKQHGWQVTVVSLLPPEAYVGLLEDAGVTVRTLDMRRGALQPAAAGRLLALLRRERPDILTSFMYHANLLGRLTARLAGVPVVISSIRNENFGGPRRDRLMRLTDRLADTTTINSRLAGEAIVRRRVVPAAKLRIVPNGLDVTRYQDSPADRAEAREGLGIAPGAFLWLAVGRLEEQKDYPTLLAALRLLAGSRPDLRVVVAGHGTLQEALETQVRQLGLGNCIRFLGVRNDVPALLAAADALVLCSAWEGLPNIIMEAMAAARPVVATATGGVPELVEEAATGFLVPARSPSALAGAMEALMALPPDARSAMGQTARERIEAQFSLEQVTGEWHGLFTELLQEKRPMLTA
jgi:glycosyltransferase involved in cell wall biosynthesis